MQFIQYFREQKFYLANWIPCLQAAGIIIYFSLKEEPSTSFVVLLFIIEAILAITLIFKKISLVTIAILSIIMGFISAQARTYILNTPIITHKVYANNIRGKISKIEHRPSHTKLLLCNIHNISLKVKCLKITVRTKIDSSIEIGDTVSLSALLYPSSNSASEFSYDFARTAYFDSISGSGFAISNVILFTKNNTFNFLEYIEILRLKIYFNIIKNVKYPQANILSALLVGKKEGIPEEIMNQIRLSGLAHLFAISGLHLSFIASFFLSVIRYLLIVSEKLTLKHNLKKLSAIITIPIISIYLLLTGSAVSAQRAFIMVTFSIIAVLIDKRKNNIRFLAVSASIILFFEPEYLFTPSFQMSFAAVLSLISSYNLTNKLIYNNNIILKFLFSTILSSTIATLGTLPYLAYHFNYFSTGGILANLLAIPLTTFIIIPLGMIYLVLIPLHLEHILSSVIEINVRILLNIAKIASQSNNLVVYIHTLTNHSIILITFGFLLLCLWQGKTRFFAFIPTIIGIILVITYQTPDLLINNKNCTIKENDNKLYKLGNGKNNFTINTWKNQNGQQQILDYKHYKNRDRRLICSNEHDCIYKKSNFSILIARNPTAISKYCNTVDLVIQANDLPYEKCEKPLITYKQLTEYGTHSIKITPTELTAYSHYTSRPWHAKKKNTLIKVTSKTSQDI